LLVVNTRGGVRGDQRLTGYYFRETRFVRRLQLRINGQPPWPCEAAALAPDTLAFTYVHPEITTPGGGGTGQSGDEENTAWQRATRTTCERVARQFAARAVVRFTGCRRE
jgi:hypothetical protein